MPNTDSVIEFKVPEPTLRRLPWYLAYAKLARQQGETHLSSTQIAQKIGIDASQVAKDFSFVTVSGKTRVGYEIDELIRYKENISKTESLLHDEIEVDNELIDYSESNNISKILFLQKLGLIEYMRGLPPFNTSINSLANALSGVTGIKTVTIQPMLNAMLNEGTSDKNNPLKSTKTVNVVVNKLVNIGYKAV